MIRTGYSFKTAVGHLPDVMSRLKECNWPAAPIADRCSTFGFVKWTKLCAVNEMRPVYGVELAVTPQLGQKKPVLDYWTFLAKDSLRPLHDLIYSATSNPGKEPSLTYAQALAAQGVFKISGERVLIDKIVEPPEDFYVGLSPATSRGLFKMAFEGGHQFCAMDNNLYPRAEDREFYRILLGKRSNTQSYPQHIMTREEWEREMHRIGATESGADITAFAARKHILSQCTAALKKATLLQPAKPKTLRQMCVEGAAIVGCDLTDKVYADRLDRELAMIEEKKFEDYFYIVADLVQWAKERMVVGPGRGSSSGSLVCYLLRITAIDPIPYGLLFERFIDVTRSDLPDIDIDFDDSKREQVFEYAKQKYGIARVAYLGTVGMFKPKSVLNTVGVALRIPKWQIAKVQDNIILRSSGDSRAMQQIEDTLTATEAGRALLTQYPEITVANRMEGHPSNSSQHAAGLLMTEDNIMEYVAMDARNSVCMCDKRDAEELNLLKIDALGLTQLSVFGRTLELIGKPNKSGFLETLPLDEKEAFDVLNTEHFSGIFQFTGRSLKNLVKQSGVSCLDDMVAITALARPGPMGTGGAGAWARRKAGKEAVTYPHELLKPYLEETLGIVTMQEQVMRIGRELGDLSWKDVTALRKAMSKSLGTEYFDQFGDRWKANAIKKGMPQDIAQAFWKDLCAFGLWGFNKSHAVAYGVVSYWCCWLKAHYPLEFAAATLDSLSSTDQQMELLKELAAEGINYVAIDPLHSGARWQPATREDGSRVLTGPLTNVKGIGSAAVKQILEARAAGKAVPERYAKLLASATTEIDTLTPVSDRVTKLADGDLRKFNIISEPMPVKNVQSGVAGEVMIIAVVNKIAPRDENEAVNVEKRKAWGGGVYNDGKTKSVNLFFKDDTDEIFCKIDRFNYERLAPDLIERGRPGRAIYAVKGTVPKDFRMIKINQLRYIGDLEQRMNQHEDNGRNANESNNTGVAE